MRVFHAESRSFKEINIDLVQNEDFKHIPKSKFYFDWKTETNVYKLSLIENNEILGLMALMNFERETRIEIKLLAVSKENRGKYKKYESVTGNLIAYACREALKFYGAEACVSLLPKPGLKEHYIYFYGMQNAGRQVFLDGKSLFKLIQQYDI